MRAGEAEAAIVAERLEVRRERGPVTERAFATRDAGRHVHAFRRITALRDGLTHAAESREPRLAERIGAGRKPGPQINANGVVAAGAAVLRIDDILPLLVRRPISRTAALLGSGQQLLALLRSLLQRSHR